MVIIWAKGTGNRSPEDFSPRSLPCCIVQPDQYARITRLTSSYSPRFFVAMLVFLSVFRFHAVGYRVEIENFVFLNSVQKRHEANDNFEFTKYVVKEITLLFPILWKKSARNKGLKDPVKSYKDLNTSKIIF